MKKFKEAELELILFDFSIVTLESGGTAGEEDESEEEEEP